MINKHLGNKTLANLIHHWLLTFSDRFSARQIDRHIQRGLISIMLTFDLHAGYIRSLTTVQREASNTRT